MKRTTISLPDDVAAALEREARRRRVPVSQVAREAIEGRLGLSNEGVRSVSFIGIVHSVEPSTASEDIEGFLAEHWANDIARDR
jgi:metal-responsive CopG/Arc/MetJ family transcriptional regulator